MNGVPLYNYHYFTDLFVGLVHRFTSSLVAVASLLSGSLAFLSPWLVGNENWAGNAFMLSLPYTQLVNLHSVSGFVLLFWGLYYLLLALQKKSFKYYFVAGTLFAFLFAVKIFYAIPILFAFGVVTLIKALQKPSYLGVLVFSFAFVLAVLWLITGNHGQGSAIGSDCLS